MSGWHPHFNPLPPEHRFMNLDLSRIAKHIGTASHEMHELERLTLYCVYKTASITRLDNFDHYDILRIAFFQHFRWHHKLSVLCTLRYRFPLVYLRASVYFTFRRSKHGVYSVENCRKNLSCTAQSENKVIWQFVSCRLSVCSDSDRIAADNTYQYCIDNYRVRSAIWL